MHDEISLEILADVDPVFSPKIPIPIYPVISPRIPIKKSLAISPEIFLGNVL